MKIGISIGDINGVGPETIIKALENNRALKNVTIVIYGAYKVFEHYKQSIPGSQIQFHSINSAQQALAGKYNIVTAWQEQAPINVGKANIEGGQYAIKSLDKAMEDLKAKNIDALVTAPINKFAMQSADFGFPGHTEYLTHHDSANESLMLMVSDQLRVGIVTNHIPVSKVASAISKQLILDKVKILNKALIEDFDIDRPVIAILGLNPHASDQGAIGDEEEKIIKPAILEAKKQGYLVTGPHPADGFFGNGSWSKVDAVLAMYHDQGLVPFKSLAFGGGVNVTCGLSFVRTSPDHGTAFDIAGTNTANPASMMEALYTAIDIVRSRKDYHESRANALVRREKQSAGIHD
jgi:4-hydroxythreonine-4-phosphate dehydrogenase